MENSTQRGEMTSSSDNCNFTDIDNLAWKVQLGIFIPTFILGLLLNILALCEFCCLWRKQTKTSVYMINLALADVLLLLSLPAKLYSSVTPVRGLLCSFIQAAYYVNTYTSIFIIVCITVDRYRCLKHPFEGRANQSPRCAVLICCFFWALAWICSTPLFLFHNEDSIKCFRNMSDEMWSSSFIVSLEIFGFLIPLAVMAFCSSQTIQILLNHNNQAERAVERGSLRVIRINFIVFLVCFTPVHIGIFLQCLVRNHVITDCGMKRNISLFLQLSMTFANLNCCLDAIFYYFAAKKFLKTLLKRVISLCPVFRLCAMRWACQQQENAQDISMAEEVPQGEGLCFSSECKPVPYFSSL